MDLLLDTDIDMMIILDHPQVKVSEEKRVYHPKLKQDHLIISCNVSADPSPDVNWQRGRVVLSTHDTKVHHIKYFLVLIQIFS